MYKLRPEQQAAVDQTYQYWQQHNSPREFPKTARQFLWNAKPRFGKTLATYEFAQKIHAQRILIITNRPAVSDSWSSDFQKHIAPQTDYIFVHSRSELIRQPDLLARPLIFFISLQDIKGKDIASDDFKAKNQWIFDVEKNWDLLIIDEGHEGIKTVKTSAVLNKLKTNFTLCLSGTPFRALADKDFSAEQIFNWTYLDEQKSYPDRPRLDFRVCELPDYLTSAPFSGTSAPSTDTPAQPPSAMFDLGELFRTSGAEFIHPELVRAWLDHVASIFQRQPDLRHTFWLLSRVNDCKALQSLLVEHPFFRDHQVILAAGKPTSDSATSSDSSRTYAGQKVLAAVRNAIGSHPNQTKTITLSCGQLTTGVTVPEWTAVFMLYSSNDLSRLSSAQYLQAVFRAQNPASAKPKSYVFDFAPDRALTVLQDYAESLCNLPAARALSELLQYLDVSALAPSGILTPLSATDVVELPLKLVAKEIVDGGFIASNKLFNVQNIFRISEPARKIISKLSALHKNRLEKSPRPLAAPMTELDPSGQPTPNVGLINQAFHEVLKNPKYHKFSAKNRQKLHNLALLEAAKKVTKAVAENVAAENIEDIALDNLSPADQILFKNALREINSTARRLARRHKKHEEDDYRDKLRGFSRTIPMLLHIYGEPDFTFSDLAEKIPDHIFSNLTGLTQQEFALLRREQYFNEPNCDLAIREFMRRERDLSAYFLPTQTKNIFDFIPLQYGARIFTPKPTAGTLIAKLRFARPELFRSREATFFDPAAKSGLLLALIVRELYQNQRSDFPSDHDCLLYILTRQIYAWSPDAISHRATLNTILSFVRTPTIKFSDPEIAELRQHLQQFNPLSAKGILDFAKVQSQINQTWKENMKFDVIISNPPYQLGRRQIYADFYKLAVDLDPELLCMVFPQGWQKPHNHNGLGQLNNAKYKRDPHLASIDNYDRKSAEKLFPNIGTGGINIVLRDRNYDNHGAIPQLISGEKSSPLVLPLDTNDIAKPSELTPLIEQLKYLPKVEALGSSRKPYGFYADPLRHPEKYHLTLHKAPQKPDDVRLFGLFADGSRGYRYISRASLPKASNNIDRHKLFVPKAWGNMATNIGLGGSYSNICVASPGDVCSETFIEFGPFSSRNEAIKAAKYFMTKFFRALLFLAKDSQNTAKDKYRYIPLPDFSSDIWQSKIPALDQKLFDLYGIAPATRDFIIDNLQLRSEANIEIL